MSLHIPEDQGTFLAISTHRSRLELHSAGMRHIRTGWGRFHRTDGINTSSKRAKSAKDPHRGEVEPVQEWRAGTQTPLTCSEAGICPPATGTGSEGSGRGTTGEDRASEEKSGPGARRVSSSASSASVHTRPSRAALSLGRSGVQGTHEPTNWGSRVSFATPSFGSGAVFIDGPDNATETVLAGR